MGEPPGRRRGHGGNLSSSRTPTPITPKITRRVMGNEVVGQAAGFLLKVATLEAVRRVSRWARCPRVWHGVQALQFLCYPPFNWIQKWAPFRGLIEGVQMFSRPMLFLSIATAFSDESDTDAGTVESRGSPNGYTETIAESPSHDFSLEERSNVEVLQRPTPENWLLQLYEALDSQGISIPDRYVPGPVSGKELFSLAYRINEDELHKFYTAASGDFATLLSMVKKTIRWRETYRLMSEKELEMWLNVVFWHGFDVEHRPCLVVRLGQALINLPLCQRPCFVQAIISQVEYGVLHLVDKDKPYISVLVDCDGITPLRIPMQMVRLCASLLQENYPDHLGYLLVIRLPPVVRVIAQTLFQVLKPTTRKKMRITGSNYHRAVSEHLQTLPSYLGGSCSCKICSEISLNSQQRPRSAIKIRKIERGDPVTNADNLLETQLVCQDECHSNDNWDRLVRTAVIGILMVFAFVALVAGMYDPESRLF